MFSGKPQSLDTPGMEESERGIGCVHTSPGNEEEKNLHHSGLCSLKMHILLPLPLV